MCNECHRAGTGPLRLVFNIVVILKTFNSEKQSSKIIFICQIYFNSFDLF